MEMTWLRAWSSAIALLRRYQTGVGMFVTLALGVLSEEVIRTGTPTLAEFVVVGSVPLLFLAGRTMAKQGALTALYGGLAYGLLLLLGSAASARPPLTFVSNRSFVESMSMAIIGNLIFGVLPVVLGVVSSLPRVRHLVVGLVLSDQMATALVLGLGRTTASRVVEAALAGAGLVLPLLFVFSSRLRVAGVTLMIMAAGLASEVFFFLVSQVVVVPG